MDLPQSLRSSAFIAAVRKGNLAYFINIQGEKLKLGEFQFADRFSCGWACVNEGGTRIANPQGVVGGNFGFLNPHGDHMNIRFDEASHFSEDRAVIPSGNGAYLIDREGEIVAERFSMIYSFSDGLAAATKGENIGYINLEGKWEIMMKPADIIESFSNGIARIFRGETNGFINLT